MSARTWLIAAGCNQRRTSNDLATATASVFCAFDDTGKIQNLDRCAMHVDGTRYAKRETRNVSRALGHGGLAAGPVSHVVRVVNWGSVESGCVSTLQITSLRPKHTASREEAPML